MTSLWKARGRNKISHLMDSIQKKMQSLAQETVDGKARAEKWERQHNAIDEKAEQSEEHVKNLQKKFQKTESKFDVCTEDLFNQSLKLEEMEKRAGAAEQMVGDRARRLLLLEENSIKSEERLAGLVTNMAKTSKAVDNCSKIQQEISEECSKKGENNDGLEQHVKDAQYALTESENKYETLARKLATVEAEAVRAEERAEGVEIKLMDIEEELKIVGQKQQTLEVSEETALGNEEKLQKQIKELMKRLLITDTRSENSEMDILRLNVRIDKVEEDLVVEKMKIKDVSDDLNKCFNDMLFI